MYLSVDCARLINDEIVLYEFYDRKVDDIAKEYYKDKTKELKKLVDEVYLIHYESDFKSPKNIYVLQLTEGNPITILKNVDFNDFKNWYLQQNIGTGPSKNFGEIKDGGDAYVEKILSDISNYDLTQDNNGRNLITPALKGQPTHFFDFDLFHSENRFNVEFLKNESHVKKQQQYQDWELNNFQTHPNRYWNKNKKKFTTLWKACKLLNGELYLVSYSDDKDELLHLMKVISLDENGITSDIGYKLTYDNFIQWLTEMSKSTQDAQRLLENLKVPHMIRDEEFWAQPTKTWKKQLITSWRPL